MPDMKTSLTTLAMAMLLAGSSIAAQHVMPPGMSHEEHLRQLQKDAALKQRGALAMGFDQDKTVHHFLLRPTGGLIVVTVKDRRDAASLAQIRSHFQELSLIHI